MTEFPEVAVLYLHMPLIFPVLYMFVLLPQTIEDKIGTKWVLASVVFALFCSNVTNVILPVITKEFCNYIAFFSIFIILYAVCTYQVRIWSTVICMIIKKAKEEDAILMSQNTVEAESMVYKISKKLWFMDGIWFWALMWAVIFGVGLIIADKHSLRLGDAPDEACSIFLAPMHAGMVMVLILLSQTVCFVFAAREYELHYIALEIIISIMVELVMIVPAVVMYSNRLQETGRHELSGIYPVFIAFNFFTMLLLIVPGFVVTGSNMYYRIKWIRNLFSSLFGWMVYIPGVNSSMHFFGCYSEHTSIPEQEYPLNVLPPGTHSQGQVVAKLDPKIFAKWSEINNTFPNETDMKNAYPTKPTIFVWDHVSQSVRIVNAFHERCRHHKVSDMFDVYMHFTNNMSKHQTAEAVVRQIDSINHILTSLQESRALVLPKFMATFDRVACLASKSKAQEFMVLQRVYFEKFFYSFFQLATEIDENNYLDDDEQL